MPVQRGSRQPNPPRRPQQLDSVEPMQVDDPDGPQDAPSNFVVDPPSNFDLESYASGYEGPAKIKRLMFVAKHCPSLSEDALRLALAAVEKTFNMATFVTIRQKLYQCTNDSKYAENDESALFVTQVNRKSAITLERLDSDLKNYRSNSIKESIRRGFDALGDHYMDCGDLSSALKMYTRARDHCTSSRHIVSLCLNIIKVSVLLGHWQQVLSYYSKAEATQEVAEAHKNQTNLSMLSRLKCAAGLAEMEGRKYKNAARYFLQASFDHCNCPDLLSPYTIAVYGGLCALASFDRQELYTKVISSSSFKLFLELEPSLRDVISQFHQSQYTSCLSTLEALRNSFMLDQYLANHISDLYAQIRNKALIQYFSPYSSVDLHKMADAFNTDVNSLENELISLILNGMISARIDSHAKVMHSRHIDQRQAMFQKAIEVGDAYVLRTKVLLMRALLHNNGILVSQASDQSDETSVDTSPAGAAPKRMKP
ncbi:PREDICTED: COP9 signalosome complex subunit 1-like [Amphimedon queenslandica]|uniref:PCI domain-containing protein n=1 Tax=Amphimedon queenslandica TaxID=400682 RepID=A0A1X7VMS4_AMPQE|nr:PREDICTED: COP9 signalosome complex subunit 1-like [Amphimedon queenslandica]|eukprot:XP_003383480.1 PREDICTED: COP9 signalosome complex subunit 1-like [Amphimedon queenslandica]